MTTAPARSTAFLAPEANRETTFKARPPHTAEPSSRPMHGLLALSEHPAGDMAVTTFSTGALADLGGDLGMFWSLSAVCWQSSWSSFKVR